VRESELDGGLHTIVVRRAGIPLVELRVSFPLTASELTKPAGVVVLSRSLLAGTDRLDRAGVAEATERLGGRIDVGVGRDSLVLSGSVLSSHLRELLELLAEILSGATYPALEVRADRDRAADESVISLSRPEVVADEALDARLFAGHPYATGTPRPSAFRRVGHAELRVLHRATLGATSAHLVLVGDLRPARASAMAEEVLGPWLDCRRRGRPRLPALRRPRPSATLVVDRPGSVQSNLRLGNLAPSRSDHDWPATSLANLVLGGMFTSRLVKSLREQHGYTYSPWSALHHGRAGSSVAVGADVSTAVTAVALEQARHEIASLAIGGITDAELEAARRYAVGRFTFQTATLDGLANTLVSLAATGIGPGYLGSYPAALIRAERSDVEEAARRHLSPRRFVTVVVGEADQIVGPLAATDEVTVRHTPRKNVT
jgi:predicted Zn-dependent peptidase